VLDMVAAWHLVSAGPAAMLGLSDRGTLAVGYRADLVILDAADHVVATISGGRVSYMSGGIAARFVAAI
jgi:alpha-D-ribose 1-methylphosphonate 5-triphosphate diphosphatase